MNIKKMTLFGLSFFQFASFAFIAPFIVLYYQTLGFDGAQIGLLTGLSPLITLFAAPLWTGLADATLRHRLIMGIALLGSALAIFAVSVFNVFVPVLILTLLYSVFNSPVGSFADSAVMATLAEEKEMYGRIRVGGTIGFALVAPLAGLVSEQYGLGGVLRIGAVLMLVTLVISQTLSYRQAKAIVPTPGSARQLLTNPRWLPFMLLAFAGGLGIAAANTFLLPHMESIGTPKSMLGWALTFGTFSEIPVLFFGNYLLKWFKPTGLLFLTIFLTGIRLLLFGVAHSFEFGMVLQIFNGITFPAMWVAGVAYADENAPAGLGSTVQGLFAATVFGFGSAVGGLAGGPIMESLGGHNFYLIFGSVVLVIMVLAGLLQRFIPMKPQPVLEINKEA